MKALMLPIFAILEVRPMISHINLQDFTLVAKEFTPLENHITESSVMLIP